MFAAQTGAMFGTFGAPLHLRRCPVPGPEQGLAPNLANLIVSNTDEGKKDDQTRVEGNRLIASNTDEGKRDAQTRVEGNRLIVSNTDEWCQWWLGEEGDDKQTKEKVNNLEQTNN
jgi:hypothetical protein